MKCKIPDIDVSKYVDQLRIEEKVDASDLKLQDQIILPPTLPNLKLAPFAPNIQGKMIKCLAIGNIYRIQMIQMMKS